MSVFLLTERLWEGLDGDLPVSCLPPINMTALHAAVAARSLPGRLATFQIKSPHCVHPQDHFHYSLITTIVCALLS